MPVVTHKLLFNIVNRIIAAANSIGTTERIQVSDTDTDILWMFWRSRSLFEGVKLLLQENLADEAMLLGRSIFEESVRIGQIRRAGDQRAGLVLRWRLESIQQSKGLMEEARRVGIDMDWAKGIAALEEQRRTVLAHAKSIGIERLPKLLSVKDAARALGRMSAYWMFQSAHEMVHGSRLMTQMWRRRDVMPGVADFYAKTGDIGAIAGPVDLAGRALLLAMIDVAEMFGRGNVSEMRSLLSELDELKPPPMC